MTPMKSIDIRVLAIDPAARGFGFSVLEGPRSLIDWGTKGARSRTQAETLDAVKGVIGDFQPDVIVVEDPEKSRRGRRVKTLVRAIEKLAVENGVRFRRFSGAEIRRTFLAQNSKTKHQIALNLALRFPELTPWVPPYRKAWMSEDRRIRIFDSVALAMTLFEGRSSPGQRHLIPDRLGFAHGLSPTGLPKVERRSTLSSRNETKIP